MQENDQKSNNAEQIKYNPAVTKSKTSDKNEHYTSAHHYAVCQGGQK